MQPPRPELRTWKCSRCNAKVVAAIPRVWCPLDDCPGLMHEVEPLTGEPKDNSYEEALARVFEQGDVGERLAKEIEVWFNGRDSNL